jgi:hypothetical protein
MNQPDLFRIRPMIDATDEITTFVKSASIKDLIKSRQLIITSLTGLFGCFENCQLLFQ